MPVPKLLQYGMLCLIKVLQIDAGVQSTALVDAVSVHLVEQGPEAHAKPLGRLAAVARCGRQGDGDGLALRELDGVTEGDLTPSFPLSTLWRGGQRARTNEIRRLQDLLVRQHRRPFDGVLERAHVPRPRLLAQPLKRRFAQDDAAAEPAGQPGCKMPREGCDVGTP